MVGKKAIVLVIDSFGIGAAHDADKYGDSGANTAQHICESVEGPKWKNLRSMGLGNAAGLTGVSLPGCDADGHPVASYGIMKPASPGKDTTTGHWEMAGVVLDKPFSVFPAEYPSFPEKLVCELEQAAGLKILGNKAASGTAIIEELGEDHLKTGRPICYTSADSVLQIAAHEDVISVEKLYELCKVARKICDDYQVGRVIARPFRGNPGSFVRTPARKDFGLAPQEPTDLDKLQDMGVVTVGVGKINDIFSGKGIRLNFPDKGNPLCLKRTMELASQETSRSRLIFTNLVDTDMNFGHRRDALGYYKAVEAIDSFLPGIMEIMNDGDMLMITADHGCDPCFRGTDHTRENVPLLVYVKGEEARSLGVLDSFSYVGELLKKFFQ